MKYLLEGQETARLKFRLLKQSDFNKWVEFFKNSDAARFLGMQDIKSANEQCKLWFDKMMDRYENDLGGMNVLIDKSSNEFIGQSGLLIQEVDGLTELEVSYSIMPQFWNNGYASEAAIKCRNYAFENDFTDSLISTIHVDNERSARVALKNGMVKTKRSVFKNMPVNIYRIDKRDWLETVR
ncbi:MAG: acetyltransferase [Cyclobacteriaceae bacterium]|nr:MAG: acetyltransferase [Cyclobacteriaceae bacterium]